MVATIFPGCISSSTRAHTLVYNSHGSTTNHNNQKEFYLILWKAFFSCKSLQEIVVVVYLSHTISYPASHAV